MKKTVHDRIKTALERTGHPAERFRYTGDAGTYFTFQMIAALPYYADDEALGLRYVFNITLNTRDDYINLLSMVMRELFREGFTITSVDGEMLDTETGVISVPLTVTEMEE